MNRLIDANDFKKFLQALCEAGAPYEDVIQLLDKQPTAFDTEQVIHNLECEKTIWVGKKITTTEVMRIDDAIDIVKKGGVG